MKTATNISDVKTLLENVTSRDVCETLKANGELEDAIFQQLERVQAMSSMQCHLDASEPPGNLPNRLHYSQLLDDQIKTLRQLLDRYVG